MSTAHFSAQLKLIRRECQLLETTRTTLRSVVISMTHLGGIFRAKTDFNRTIFSAEND